MGNTLLIVGVLLNSALIVINRFIHRLPSWLQFPLMLLAIGMMIAGIILMKTA